MQRLLLLLIVIAVPVAAQIAGLATTDDGGVLYFASPLRLRGTEQFPHEKIFRLQDEEFELFAQVEREQITDTLSNFFRLHTTDVSGDGRVISYAGRRECVGGSSCVKITFDLSTIESPDLDEPLVLPGLVQLSVNGRYALQAGANGPDIVRNRIDLTTGEEVAFTEPIALGSLTSDGHLVLLTSSGPAVWTPEETTVFPIQGEHLGSATLNDQGTHLIYESFSPRELHSIDLASGIDTFLAEGDVLFFQPSVSNDGEFVLYVTAPADSEVKGADAVAEQAFLINSDGTGRRQLTDAPEGVSTAILSGDGTVAYAATPIGRLLRIDVVTGATEELIPRTPFITAIEGGAAPGSLSFMYGTGLSETVAVADTPLPESLGGVEVRLGGLPMPILLVAPNDVRFQIPFEIEPGDFPVGIATPEGPFEQVPVVLTVSPTEPRFIKNGVEVVIPGVREFEDVIVNHDFSELIVEDNKANPSDIVTLYMTGLGITEPPVTTGELTPIGPLFLPPAPVECSWLQGVGQRPLVETFFAGLAPGLIGVYQVTVRLPADPPPFQTDPTRTRVSIICGAPDGPTASASVPIRLDP